MKIGEAFNPYGQFTGSVIPNAVMRSRSLTPLDKLCLARLMQFAGKNGECWPSQRVLAMELGASKRQVQRCLGRLMKDGFLRARGHFYEFPWNAVYEQPLEGGAGGQYVAHHQAVVGDKMSRGGRQNVAFGVDKMSTKENQLRESMNKVLTLIPEKKPPLFETMSADVSCGVCGGRGYVVAKQWGRPERFVCHCQAS